MKTQRTFFVSLSLTGILVGGAALTWVEGGGAKVMVSGKPHKANPADQPPAVRRSANFHETSEESTQQPELDTWGGEPSEPIRSNPKMLPGVFRGDWGETSIYSRNDRVNHEGAAYLSLENDNQNQPPVTSPTFWQLVKNFNERHEEACLSPVQGADLTECDFSEAVSLKDMNLNGAALNKARLSGELGSADLSGANLSGGTVIGSLIISPDTRLENANLSKLNSDGNNPLIAELAKLNNTNFSEANLYGAKMKSVYLVGAQLTGATLTGAELTAGRLDGAELSNTNLTYANLSEGVLANAALNEADLSEANLTDADFSNANLQQANLAGTELAGADLSGTNLSGANLAAAKNADSAIIDSQTDFTSAVCPDGVTVDGTWVTTCVGHGF